MAKVQFNEKKANVAPENQYISASQGKTRRLLIRKLTALTAVMSLGAGSESARLSLWNKIIKLTIYCIRDIEAI